MQELNSPETTAARTLFGYWQQVRGIRQMPARSDIDPNELQGVLRNLQLFEVIGGGERFFGRLSGEAAREALGFDPTGQFLDETPVGLERERATEALQKVVSTCAPTFAVRDVGLASGQRARCEDVLLPLSQDGKLVNMVLWGIFLMQGVDAN